MDCITCLIHTQSATCSACTTSKINAFHSNNAHLIRHLAAHHSRAQYLLEIASGSRPTILETPKDLLHIHFAKRSSRNAALRAVLVHKITRLKDREQLRTVFLDRLNHRRTTLTTNERAFKRSKCELESLYRSELSGLHLKLSKTSSSILFAWNTIVPELLRVFQVNCKSWTNSSTPQRGTIIGLPVPLDMDIRNIPEEQLNAALGFLAKMTCLLATYLRVPLPFDIQLRASVTSADLHFRRARNPCLPFAELPNSSTPGRAPTSCSSSSSNILTNSEEHARWDNLLPVHVGHSEGAERTAMGLAMLMFQITTLAAKCGVHVPFTTSSLNKRRRKLIALDPTDLLVQICHSVTKNGLPQRLSPCPKFFASSTKSTTPELIQPVPFRCVLSAISRKMYWDESESGFRILPKRMRGMDPPNRSLLHQSVGFDLPMSETGVLVPSNQSVTHQSSSSAHTSPGVGTVDNSQILDSDEDDDDEEDEDDLIGAGNMDPDSTLTPARALVAGLQQHLGDASFINIDPSSAISDSSLLLTSTFLKPGVMRPSRGGKLSTMRSSVHLSRSLMVRSILAAADTPPPPPPPIPPPVPSSTSTGHSSPTFADNVSETSSTLDSLDPLPIRSSHPKPKQTKRPARTAPPAPLPQAEVELPAPVSRVRLEDDWEELHCDLSRPGDVVRRSTSVGNAKHHRGPGRNPPAALSRSSSLSSLACMTTDLLVLNEPLDEDIELVDGSDLEQGLLDHPPPPILSSVWDFGRRALSSSYHLAVHASSATTSHLVTEAQAIMTDPTTTNTITTTWNPPLQSGHPYLSPPPLPGKASSTRAQPRLNNELPRPRSKHVNQKPPSQQTPPVTSKKNALMQSPL